MESVDSTLNVTSVTPVADNVDEVLFYLQTTLRTNEGDQRGGGWFVAHVANTSEGRKLLKVWIQDYEHEMMQTQIKSNNLSKDNETAWDNLVQDILNDYNANKNINKAPAISSNDPADKVSSNPTQPRKTTIDYKRDTVAAAAIKYAYNYNTLFVAESNDCTNFISQSIWQSPNWGFDKIGNRNDVKWSCTKNSSNKYKYDTLSWVGANETLRIFCFCF